MYFHCLITNGKKVHNIKSVRRLSKAIVTAQKPFIGQTFDHFRMNLCQLCSNRVDTFGTIVDDFVLLE